MPGNTSDKTTLPAFIARIHDLYGQADRIWIMDRGIPSEKQLRDLREAQPPVSYLVGTPRARLGKYEKQLTELPWQKIRENVEVKLFSEDNELYVLARSEGRQAKERAMRRRKLARLLRTLRQLRKSRKNPLPRDQFLQRLGAAKSKAGRARSFVDITLPAEGQPVDRQTFTFGLKKEKLKDAEFRDGHYLLRSNLSGDNPGKLWELYMQLVEIEAAFKSLKSELVMRPIHHQLDHRILAHIFVCFMAYCLQVTLKKRLKKHASGLTPHAVLEKLATILMLEVHLPIEDGRKLILPRYTQPEKEHLLVLEKLNLTLPKQPLPRIRAAQGASATPLL
jgi:transposase